MFLLYTCFTVLVTAGVLLSSSSTLFTFWMNFELINFLFISFLISGEISSKVSLIRTITYFLIQFVSSLSILYVYVMSFNNSLWFEKPFYYFMIFWSLWVKMGGWPFHSWMLLCCQQTSWKKLWGLLVIQKMVPLSLVWKLIWLSNSFSIFIYLVFMVSVFAMTSFMRGCSLNHFWFYSSMINVCWLIISMHCSVYWTMMMFLTYGLSFLLLLWSLDSRGIKSLMDLINKSASFSFMENLKLWALFTTMSGYPGSLMFCGKVIAMLPFLSLSLEETYFYLLGVWLLVGQMILLGGYLLIVVNLGLKSLESKTTLLRASFITSPKTLVLFMTVLFLYNSIWVGTGLLLAS